MRVQHVVDARPRSSKSMDEPHAAVVVKQRTGVDPSGHILHIMTFPFSRRILGGKCEQPLVRHAHIHIKQPVVIPQTGRPNTALVGRFVISGKRQPPGRIAEQFPMHQIPGMQHGDAGHISKRGRNHIKIFAYPDHIRIRIISVQDWIGITHLLTPSFLRRSGMYDMAK